MPNHEHALFCAEIELEVVGMARTNASVGLVLQVASTGRLGANGNRGFADLFYSKLDSPRRMHSALLVLVSSRRASADIMERFYIAIS